MSTGFEPGPVERWTRRPTDTRVLLADDDVLARANTRAMLDGQESMAVVGEVDAGRAPALLAELAPEVVLLDTDPRSPAGRRPITAILTAAAHVRVLVVSDVSDPAALFEALIAGASGYVLKTQLTRLPRAIHEVMDGRVPVDPELAALMRERLGRPAPFATPDTADGPRLTPREYTVLRHVAAGRTNEQIAGELVLSPGTVKLHVQHIIAKLGVANRTQAAVYAAQQGLLGPR